MKKSTATLALVGVGGAGIATLLAANLPGISVGPTGSPEVHAVLVAVAAGIIGSMGILAAWSFYRFGAVRSLALSAGLLSAAAIGIWGAVYAGPAAAFPFLAYGAAAHLALAATLPFVAFKRRIGPAPRLPLLAGVAVVAAGLATAAWSLQPALVGWNASPGRTAGALAIGEGAAAALAMGTFSWLLIRQKQPVYALRAVLLAGLLTLAIVPLLSILAGPWTAAWWGTLLVGAVAPVVLGVAVVAEVASRERGIELAQLRELNAMKTRFINSAAHELGTPLTPIQLQLSLLRARGDPLSEKQQKSLDTIQRNVNRLSDLTQSILEGARSQAGRFPVRLEDADIRLLLDEIAQSYVPWCEEKDISFRLVAPEVLEMHTDRRRLHQIISNYVSNAIKNSDSGGQINLLARQAPGRIRISVEDTGRGLSEDERKRLFQPFSQLDDTAMTVGSGLGLYIAKQLADRLGGYVGVESRGLGEGSTFYVDLPLEAPIDDLRALPEKALETPMVIPGAKDT